MNRVLMHSIAILSTLTVMSCGSKLLSIEPESETAVDLKPSPASQEIIKVNQIGYLIEESKVAIIPNVTASHFVLIDTDTQNEVYKNTLSNSLHWDAASGTTFKVADFSAFNQKGRFRIRVNGVQDSYSFDIKNEVFGDIHDAALKSFYLNRAGINVTAAYAQQWSRPAGHIDNQVYVHTSAADRLLEANSAITSPKGWYDAGDYGKYVVNSGIATYTLLAAFDHHRAFYLNRDIGIPESGDDIPDILDEIKWNLDWLATMQSPDGGVFHKLTTLDWPDKEMPHEDKRRRFVIGQSTSAALDFAATMAMGSRVFKSLGKTYYPIAKEWLSKAEKAWEWAKKNPDSPYIQPEDVKSGEYKDKFFVDEFIWASAELFISTGNKAYLTEFLSYSDKLPELVTPEWRDVASLGFISLLHETDLPISAATKAVISKKFLSLANQLKQNYELSPYPSPMLRDDFAWGSNSIVLNKAIVSIQAYKLTQDDSFKDVAVDSLSYILGLNPTGYSFVTGFGQKSPRFPHHRASQADDVESPVPGMLVGGTYPGQPDPCTYMSKEPALSYVDHWCSYSTNEVAINWNAPLVYVLAALQATN